MDLHRLCNIVSGKNEKINRENLVNYLNLPLSSGKKNQTEKISKTHSAPGGAVLEIFKKRTKSATIAKKKI